MKNDVNQNVQKVLLCQSAVDMLALKSVISYWEATERVEYFNLCFP